MQPAHSAWLAANPHRNNLPRPTRLIHYTGSHPRVSDTEPARLYRFGVFEANPATGELRRQGARIRIHAQPFQLLCLLLEQPGQLLTRDDIARALWPSGTYVDFDHGVNSTINRLREALGDTAANPRFVETLARRGYRFIAPVERVATDPALVSPPGAPGPSPLGTGEINPLSQSQPIPPLATAAPRANSEPYAARSAMLATPAELPSTPRPIVRALFVLLQLMYAAFYIGALANLAEIEQLLEPVPWPNVVEAVLIATAAALLPVRAFLLVASLFRPPRAAHKLLQLWPFLAPFDILWALAPFLLLHHINFGLALAFVALLVYTPFAQRSLILMGAADEPSSASAELP
ncbi:MAG TPA: winged helix-turn-helix domain-containing protein [Terracidiphilus sp.]|nr:winged helix-turn-helix domain-containing protein [Terracidiphilus sp.]